MAINITDNYDDEYMRTYNETVLNIIILYCINNM
jgi:hypothetical protein